MIKLSVFLLVLFVVVLVLAFAEAKFRGRDHIWLWDAPMNSASIWWDPSQSNKIGWSDLRGKRDNHSFWLVAWGVCFTLTIQTWPFAGALARLFRRRPSFYCGSY